MNRFELEPIFPSMLWMLVLSALLLALPWIVPVSGRSVTPQRRRTLQWIRTGCVFFILLAMLRPTWIRTESQPSSATLAILVDRSQSMTLPADATNSRFETENQLLDQLLAELRDFDESLDVRLLQFADQTREITLTPEALNELKTPPQGSETRIGAALLSAVRAAGGKPLAGVILIGDGVEVRSTGNTQANNHQASIDENEQGGARLLASLDVPLFSVPIGPPGDLQQLRDIEIDGLAESFSMFAGNESTIDFVVRTRAMSGTDIKLNLSLQREGGGEPVDVATRIVTPTESNQTAGQNIPIVAPEPGRYLLTVKAEAQEGETLLTNNAQVAFVDVRKGGGKLLYLEGQPRPEQLFLLRTLRRFPDLQVTYRWLALDKPEQWPISLGDTLANERYDLVIIGNLPAAAIGSEQLKQIQQQVGKGSALLMIGGPQTFAAGGYATSDLAATLPIKLDPKLTDQTESISAVPNQLHPITQLSADSSLAAQQKFWSGLPKFVGNNRFAESRVAPGVQVLLETQDEEPLLVVGEYGAGRVAAFAIDSTWRWWRQQQSEAHRRFWRQMMLWLLNRDSADDQLLELKLARRRVPQEQAIDFQLVQSGTETLAANELTIEILQDGKLVQSVNSATLGSTAQSTGSSMSGKLTDLQPGVYQLAVYKASSDLNAATRTPLTAVSFQVISNDSELRQPYADHVYMSQLASLTSPAGGAMFMPNEAEQLINEIKQLRHRSEAPVAKKYRIGDTPTSAWPLFIGITTLLRLNGIFAVAGV